MHSKGVMHRDIKAENVLLTEWSSTAVVKIIDFGIAARLVIGFMPMCYYRRQMHANGSVSARVPCRVLEWMIVRPMFTVDSFANDLPSPDLSFSRSHEKDFANEPSEHP